MCVLQVVVDSRLRFRQGPRTGPLVDALRRSLTEPNPEYERRQKLRLPIREVAATISFLRVSGDEVSIPRGAVHHLRWAAAQAGIELDWRPATASTGARHVPVEHLGRELRPYQREALDLMLGPRSQGYVVLACGGGKTVLGCAALGCVAEPAIVLVTTLDIQAQWAAQLAAMYDPRVRLVGDGRKDMRPLMPGEVAVCLVNTLAQAGAEADPLLRSAGALILDEVHHAPARTIRDVIDRCPARYRWGLTATDTRADGLGYTLELFFGPCILRRSPDELVEAGYLHRPLVFGLLTGWTPDPYQHRRWIAECPRCGHRNPVKAGAAASLQASESASVLCRGRGRSCRLPLHAQHLVGSLNHPSAQSAAAIDPARVGTIVEVVRAGYEAGHRALVLMPTHDGVRAVLHALRAAGIPSGSATSKAPDRALRIAQLRSGALPVLVATSLAREGLDVPALSLLVNACAGVAMGDTVQFAGRTMRPVGMAPIVVDLVDEGAYRRQWRSRRATYRTQLGAEPTDAGLATVVDAIRATGTRQDARRTTILRKCAG